MQLKQVKGKGFSVHAMKAYKESRHTATHSQPQHLMGKSGQHHTSATLLTGKNHGTHCIVDIVGPTAGLNILKKRRICCPYWDSNQRPSSPSDSHYTDYPGSTGKIQKIQTLLPVFVAKSSFEMETVVKLKWVLRHKDSVMWI